MSEWEPILDERLVEIYGFDKETLLANRRGKLTIAQKARLEKMRWPRIAKYGLVALIIFAIWFVLGMIAVGGILGGLLGVIRFILLIGFLFQVWRGFLFYWRTGQEIAAGDVLMYPGRLNKIEWNTIRIMYCERGEFYELPMREWNAFEHYKRYRVFCTPRSKVIVAAQPVHKDEPLPEAWN